MVKNATFGLAGVVLAGLLAHGGTARAAVVLSDNFDTYTDGDLVGQGGWTITGTSVVNPIQVSGGADNVASLVATGQDAYKAFTAPVTKNDGESLATSMTVNVSAASAAGDYFTHLSSPAGTTNNFYQRLFARSSDTGFQLGLVDTSGTGSVITYGTAVLPFATDHDVDVTWNFVPGGTNNDTFTVTVNGTPYLTHTWTSTAISEPTTIEAFNFRQGGSTSGPTLTVDDVVVDAVPEPAAVALIGLASVGLLRRRRAR